MYTQDIPVNVNLKLFTNGKPSGNLAAPGGTITLGCKPVRLGFAFAYLRTAGHFFGMSVRTLLGF